MQDVIESYGQISAGVPDTETRNNIHINMCPET
jgi:hypothetical protein